MNLYKEKRKKSFSRCIYFGDIVINAGRSAKLSKDAIGKYIIIYQSKTKTANKVLKQKRCWSSKSLT
jgi:hypothetical protein